MKFNIRQMTMYLGVGIMAIIFCFVFFAKNVHASTATGTIVSTIKNTGGLVNYNNISWSVTVNASTTMTMKIRTATSSNMTGAPAWSTCDDVTSGSDISSNNCVKDGQQYFQYQAYFTSSYNNASEFSSPVLNWVNVGYNAMATLISSPFNALATDNILQKLLWIETKDGSSDVVFQIRTAPNSSGVPGTWSNWMGTSSIYSYYTDPTGGESINSTHRDGSSDQWFQYKVFLVSDGTNLPVLSDATLQYDSKIPIVTSASPNTVSSGTSSMAVTISGSDFYSGATVQFINGNRTISATNVTIVSSTTITCRVDLANEPAGYYDIKVTNSNTGTNTKTDAYLIRYNTGTFTSSIKDMGGPTTFGVISWSADTGASSTMTMKIRSSVASDMTGATAWDSCDTVISGSLITGSNCVTNGHRYIQYQASYQSEYDGSANFITPVINSVNIGYDSMQTLISNKFDTLTTDASLQSISWSQSNPGASAIKFQLRTSSDGSNWSSWLGPTSASDYYTDYQGSETINSTQRDGSSDRYFQYKAYLTADGANLPVLNDVTLNYISVIPIITSISPISTSTSPTTLALTINGSDFRSNASVVLSNDMGQSLTGTVTASTSNQIICNFTTVNMPGGRYTVTVTNTNLGVGRLYNAFYIQNTSGVFASAVKDLGSGKGMGTFTWTGTYTPTSTITMRVRSANNLAMTGAPSWSTCNTIANGESLTANNCITNGHQYAQYQATFNVNYSTSSAFAMPILDTASFNTYYYSTSTLTSSPFDTEDIHNVINSIAWTESVPGISDVRIQIRTSPGESGSPTSWSSWYGPTGTSDFYTNPAGGLFSPLIQDGLDDRWVQYKITLVPDFLNNPVISDLQFGYVTASTTPLVVTLPVEWTGSKVVKARGEITDDGTGPISVRGFKYGLTQSDTWQQAESVYKQIGPYEISIDNLQPNTTYYIRAFAVNARGTSYGDYISFTTEERTMLNPFIFKRGAVLKGGTVLR